MNATVATKSPWLWPWPTTLLSSTSLSTTSEYFPIILTSIWSQTPWTHILIPSLVGYIVLCRALRHRRERAVCSALGYPPGADRATLARMTADEAQIMIQSIMSYEMPLFHLKSLEFALFKTYGVESISKLLLATRNLTDPIFSRKRYEDTGVLIAEFLLNPPSSARAAHAVSRMNWLHRGYQRAGRISNADLLYTLSVFVTEPARFAALYEWRPLNDAERCAYGVFWKAMGDAMGISWEAEAEAEAGEEGEGGEEGGELEKEKEKEKGDGRVGLRRAGRWRDGLEFFDDIARWAKAYEVRHMRPSPVCARPARALIPMITYWVPRLAKPFAEECVCVLVGDRAREAFMLPEPGIVAATTVFAVLTVRRLVMRNLCLPRLSEKKNLREADPATGRMHLNYTYGNYPFYIRPTSWNRWGPAAWAVWLVGGKVPGDDPDEFKPDGYSFDDMGPSNMAYRGKDEMRANADELLKSGRGSCPFI